jgi:hypothetical protein
MMPTAARVRELKHVYAAGPSATIGAINPYRGQIVSTAAWRAGYRKMIEAMLAKSPPRQAYLRNRKSVDKQQF